MKSNELRKLLNIPSSTFSDRLKQLGIKGIPLNRNNLMKFSNSEVEMIKNSFENNRLNYKKRVTKKNRINVYKRVVKQYIPICYYIYESKMNND